jgi:hypothetical protein
MDNTAPGHGGSNSEHNGNNVIIATLDSGNLAKLINHIIIQQKQSVNPKCNCLN